MQNCEIFVRFAKEFKNVVSFKNFSVPTRLGSPRSARDKEIVVKCMKLIFLYLFKLLIFRFEDFFLKKVVKIIWRIQKSTLPLHRQKQRNNVDDKVL